MKAIPEILSIETDIYRLRNKNFFSKIYNRFKINKRISDVVKLLKSKESFTADDLLEIGCMLTKYSDIGYPIFESSFNIKVSDYESGKIARYTICFELEEWQYSANVNSSSYIIAIDIIDHSLSAHFERNELTSVESCQTIGILENALFEMIRIAIANSVKEIFDGILDKEKENGN